MTEGHQGPHPSYSNIYDILLLYSFDSVSLTYFLKFFNNIKIGMINIVVIYYWDHQGGTVLNSGVG